MSASPHSSIQLVLAPDSPDCQASRGDPSKAAMFLRVYRALAPDDPWASAKHTEYESLGLA